ncbi:hypothetical protein L6452_13792 [Arctium lappa]|uniref:Uncharacterized protein n=1 Tax=Arctium lappa TaxID=4217 RepID=A0ACB9CJ58_ARCLA|nr:hypothetical protein L6452_13792 [Arctium lappa]
MGPPVMLLDFTTYPGPSSHATTDITILGPLCLWPYFVEFHLKDLQTQECTVRFLALAIVTAIVTLSQSLSH